MCAPSSPSRALLRGSASARPRSSPRISRPGLLLLEDFGDDTYTRLLAGGAATRRALYALAVDVLIALHRRFAARPRRRCRPTTTQRLLTEAALLVDWYLPAIAGRPTDAERCARNYLALWRALLPVARGVPDDAGAARLSCRQSDAARRAQRRRRVRPARFPGRGARPAQLRSRLAARGCAARRARRRSRAPCCARYLAAFPELDRAAFDALLCRARRAAQLQDRRHLHAALRARRQAALSRAHPARVAPDRAGSAPSRAGAGRALARPAHPATLRRIPPCRSAA